jgi:hypothetical protein
MLCVSGLLVTAMPLLGVGCAASAEGVPASSEGVGDDAITASERTAVLDGLRVRVDADFANVASLRGFKLVFVVKKLESDVSRAFVSADLMKRDAHGRDAKLTDADFQGSVYEGDIKEGLFDGEHLHAALEKRNGAWSTMKKQSPGDDFALEAYVMGSTDAPWFAWPEEFGIPKAWIR